MANFVILKIRCRDRDIKKWYGTQYLVEENFIDLYNRFARGEMDAIPIDDVMV